jgi:hypothetical protein
VKESFCAVPHTSVAPASGSAIVQDLFHDRFAVVDEEELQVLRSLSLFADLDSHLESLRKLGWDPSGSGRIGEILRSLRSKGLILDSEEFLSRIRKGPGAGRPSPLERIAIPHGGNRAYLDRLLTGLGRLSGRIGRTLRIIICDDRRDGTKPLFPEAPAGYSGDLLIRTIDRRERAGWADTLARELGSSAADARVIRFGLTGDGFPGPAIGASRNTLLLLNSGARFLFHDDDTLPRARATYTDSPGLSFSYLRDPTWTRYFPDGGFLETMDAAEILDPIGMHDRFLGAPLSAVARSVDLVPRLAMCSRSLVFDLVKEPGRVVLTQPGILGDCGQSSPNPFLFAAEDLSHKLYGDPETYVSLRLSRWVLRGVSDYTVTVGPWLMATSLGVDNTSVLPPFPPVYRNEDGVWGELVKLCVPGSVRLHLPMAGYHLPDTRKFESGDMGRFRIRVSDVVSAFLDQFRPAVDRSGPQLLRDLGRYFQELGALDFEEFHRFASDALMVRIHKYLNQVQALTYRGSSCKPDWWLSDVRNLLAGVEDSVCGWEHLVPEEFSAAGPGGPENGMREYFRLFGRFLGLWPDLVEICRDRPV